MAMSPGLCRKRCWQIVRAVPRASAGFALILALWQILAWATTSIAFPDLTDILAHAPSALGALLSRHLPASLTRVALAYVAGTLAGAVVGVAMYAVPLLAKTLRGWVDFFRSIPGTITFPFFLAYFGFSEPAVALPSAWVILWITTFATFRELSLARSGRLSYLQRHNASRSFILWHLHLYALSKSIFGNSRLCVSIALAVLVAMEMMAGPNSGVGYFAKMSEETGRYAEMVVAIALSGAVGFILNAVLGWAEHHLVWW